MNPYLMNYIPKLNNFIPGSKTTLSSLGLTTCPQKYSYSKLYNCFVNCITSFLGFSPIKGLRYKRHKLSMFNKNKIFTLITIETLLLKGDRVKVTVS